MEEEDINFENELQSDESEEPKDEKQQRESTVKNKRLFLLYLERSRGMITLVCQKVGISRSLYYSWRKKDKAFAKRADEIMSIKVELLDDRLFALAMDGNVSALKFMLQSKHPDYKKKKDKEAKVHIYHHVDKPVEKKKVTFAQMIWGEAARRRESTEDLKKEFAGREFPLKPDGTPIADNEIYFYHHFIRNWFKQKDQERS